MLYSLVREVFFMKKTKISILSVAAVLVLTSCANNSSVQPSNNTTNNEQQSSSIIPISYEAHSEVSNDNFTLLVPTDVSSMSHNCKQYVDDMREQQQRLIEDKGEDADYYINDLYGEEGVDLTKGVLSGSNGGYRDGTVENDYLDDPSAEWEKGEKSDENKGVNIEFRPAEGLKDQQYVVTYSVNADFSNSISTEPTSSTVVNIRNLLVNQKYYVKVSANGQESATMEFTTGDYPRWIDARPMFNVRDHGGYMTSSGQRIKQGMVYRGGEITDAVGWTGGASYTGDTGSPHVDSSNRMRDGHITTQNSESQKVFRDVMGMVGGLEIDLRSSSETNGYPKVANKCGFADTNGDIDYKLIPISSYANGVNNNKPDIKKCFDAFAEADEHPVYYHCYGGADRTGTVGFLLGAVLGMSYTDLVIDFELTSYSSNPSRNYRSHLRNGPYNDWPNFINTLKNSYGFTSSKTIKEAAEEYLINQCGVAEETIRTIRNIMLED